MPSVRRAAPVNSPADAPTYTHRVIICEYCSSVGVVGSTSWLPTSAWECRVSGGQAGRRAGSIALLCAAGGSSVAAGCTEAVGRWHRIRSELGTSTVAVRAAIGAAGLGPRLPRAGPSSPELYDVVWMRAQLEHSTVTEVARSLCCSTRSVKDAERRAGVPASRRPPPPPQLTDGSWLEAQLQQRRSDSDIAGDLGCSVKAVGQAVREHGLDGLARRRRRFVSSTTPTGCAGPLETHPGAGRSDARVLGRGRPSKCSAGRSGLPEPHPTPPPSPGTNVRLRVCCCERAGQADDSRARGHPRRPGDTGGRRKREHPP